MKKNRQAKGSKQGISKLNEEKVLEIKRLLAETNLTQRQIAKRYGVSQNIVYQINTGKLWKHVKYSPTNITNKTTYNGPVIINISLESAKQLSLFDTDEFK
jgi:predicted transcriptional regulator